MSVKTIADPRPKEEIESAASDAMERARIALAELNRYRHAAGGSDRCPRCGNLLQRKNKASRMWVCWDRIIPVPFCSGEYQYIKGCDYQRG